MRGRILVYKPDDTLPDLLTVEQPPPLKFLQGVVGGTVEEVVSFNQYNGQRCVALCNENGKSMQLPVNHEATKLWWNLLRDRGVRRHHPDDRLRGRVVILTGDDEFMEAL